MYSSPCLGALCHTPPGPSFSRPFWIRLVPTSSVAACSYICGDLQVPPEIMRCQCAGSVGADRAIQSASSSKPPAVSGSLHLPPIPRFHIGSSHGRQVIGIDKALELKGWREAHLYPAHSISHVPLENVLGERCVGYSIHKWIWDTVSGINASQKTA